jgi:restriction endonuclease Mrr
LSPLLANIALNVLDEHVHAPEIQGSVSALHGAQANRGVFITTSSFTNEANCLR